MTVSSVRIRPPTTITEGPQVTLTREEDEPPGALQYKPPSQLQAEAEIARIRRVSRLVSPEAEENAEKWLASKAPIDPSGVVAYLMLFGYPVADARTWATGSAPTLYMSMTEHAEVGDHTWYAIDCCLIIDGFVDKLRWSTARRLCHLRELLYDHIKRDCGQKYDDIFTGAHFAHHGGIAGTTSRLRAWFNALAQAINDQTASPYVAALTLRLLDAPHLLAMDERLNSADVGIDSAMMSALMTSQPVSDMKDTPPAVAAISPEAVVIGASTCIDPLDVAIDLKEHEDESTAPASDASTTSGEQTTARASATCTDIDSPDLPAIDEDMCAPICEELEVIRPSGGYPDAQMPESDPFLQNGLSEGGLPIIDEEKTNLSEMTIQDQQLPAPTATASI